MREKHIVRRTLSNPTKGRTDWERLRKMSEEEIDRGAADDPDNPPWTEEELRNAKLVQPPSEPKVPLSIRLDREVVDYFKEEGAGYQSRIAAVLLAYVRTRQRAALDAKERTQAGVGEKTHPGPKPKTTTKHVAAKRGTRSGSTK